MDCTLSERYWSKVNRDGPTQPHMMTPCWPWTGAKHSQAGYGRIIIDGRDTLAHIVGYEIQIGPVPEGACVLHRCDFPPCQRGDHLFTGSRAVNNADRHAKGRDGVQAKGAASPRAKLTEEEVAAIRRLRGEGLGARGIRARLGLTVSIRTVELILAGKTWKEESYVAR